MERERRNRLKKELEEAQRIIETKRQEHFVKERAVVDARRQAQLAKEQEE